MKVEFGSVGAGEEHVLLDGRDVTQKIRTEEAGAGASRVAAWPAVRAALTDRQRAFASAPGLVADGRDMGTVIFPDARLKVFLTASAEERAQRRHKQLKGKGSAASLAALSREIAERDLRDSTRQVAPLKPAPDAQLLDSTGLTSRRSSSESSRSGASEVSGRSFTPVSTLHPGKSFLVASHGREAVFSILEGTGFPASVKKSRRLLKRRRSVRWKL